MQYQRKAPYIPDPNQKHVWQNDGKALYHTKYVRPPPEDDKPMERPKNPAVGFTGFVPRHLREPASKQGGVPANIKRPQDKMVGFTGFVPKGPEKEPTPPRPNQAREQEQRFMPGYKGHVPNLKAGNAYGQTFGSLTNNQIKGNFKPTGGDGFDHGNPEDKFRSTNAMMQVNGEQEKYAKVNKWSRPQSAGVFNSIQGMNSKVHNLQLAVNNYLEANPPKPKPPPAPEAPKERYDIVELRKQLTQNTTMLRKINAQGDFYQAGAVVPNFTKDQFMLNEPRPVQTEQQKQEENKAEVVRPPSGKAPSYQPKKTSSYVPSKQTQAELAADIEKGSKTGTQPAQSVHYSALEPVKLDVAGEKEQAREAWQEQPKKEEIKESKSVGKPLKMKQPEEEKKMELRPEDLVVEPAKRDDESIQAVSAIKIPQSVLKKPESSDPTQHTRIKNVMNWKYGRHEDNKHVKSKPVEKVVELDWDGLEKQSINGLIFNKYDDRPVPHKPYARDDQKIGAYIPDAKQQDKVQLAGQATGHHNFRPKNPEQQQTNALQKDQYRQHKFTMLAGTTNNAEKWWYNEGVGCSQSEQGDRADRNIQGKITGAASDNLRVGARRKNNEVTGKITGHVFQMIK